MARIATPSSRGFARASGAEFDATDPVGIDGVTAAALARLSDTTVNGFVVELAGNEAGYGRGQPFLVLEEGDGDATDQTAAGSVLFRVDSKGSIGTGGGIHVASGLHKSYGGAQAVWIQPNEDIVHLVMTAAPGTPAQPFLKLTKNDGTVLTSIDKEGAVNVFRNGVGVGWFAGDNPPFGVRLGVNAGATDVIPLLVGAIAGQTADLMRVALGATVYAKFNKAGYLIIKKNAAPADGDLAAGEMALWFDQTDGAAKLMVKAKQASGTVRTGSLALS